jgi:hypothetical protein
MNHHYSPMKTRLFLTILLAGAGLGALRLEAQWVQQTTTL